MDYINHKCIAENHLLVQELELNEYTHLAESDLTLISAYQFYLAPTQVLYFLTKFVLNMPKIKIYVSFQCVFNTKNWTNSIYDLSLVF